MSKVKVIFTLNGKDILIECTKEEKMRDICQKYAKKIEAKLDSLLLLYEKKELNLELSFEEQANPADKSNNEMNI